MNEDPAPGYMTRRSLLIGLAAWSCQLAAGCAKQPSDDLRISLLRGSVPNQLFGSFRNHVRRTRKDISRVDLTVIPEAKPQDLFDLLQTWKQEGKLAPEPSWKAWLGWVPVLGKPDRAIVSDLSMLGDAWLSLAIRQGLVQPIDLNPLMIRPTLNQNAALKRLVTRNSQGLPDANGQVWAVPHRIGSTMIAYRQDIFADRKLAPPQDWGDLWRPELRGKITLLDQPREVIGLVLKKLGKSYNTADLNAVANLKAELQSLQNQVKLYSSDRYLEPLLLDDAWVSVGWSSDILPLMQRQQKVAAVVPRSGTALWAELWVRPAKQPAKGVSPTSTQWLDFYADMEIANQLAEATRAMPPVLLTASEGVSDAVRESAAFLPPAVLQASEFLEPLPESTLKQHIALWQDLRQPKA
jgi:putative spermidine/putrescine transport system substrate-binding protein